MCISKCLLSLLNAATLIPQNTQTTSSTFPTSTFSASLQRCLWTFLCVVNFSSQMLHWKPRTGSGLTGWQSRVLMTGKGLRKTLPLAGGWGWSCTEETFPLFASNWKNKNKKYKKTRQTLIWILLWLLKIKTPYICTRWIVTVQWRRGKKRKNKGKKLCALIAYPKPS